MTNIQFTKMQGLGNDFIIIDFEEYKKLEIEEKDLGELAKKLCHRNFGIGADGLIIVNPNTTQTDIGWFFYNSDGTTAQMCGNGIRCFARYVYDKKLIDKKIFSVETLAGAIVPELVNENTVKVNMSKPILEPNKIPSLITHNINFDLILEEKTFKANAVSMGNPHCIIFTDEDTKQMALKYGRQIETHAIFPEKTNVEFVKVLSRSEINLDVWERGCAITMACGTGACASVVAAILNDLCDNKVKVNLPGGSLIIEWDGSYENTHEDVFMSGPAEYVFTGEIDI